ncbi:MAG: sigma-70 family RNA polymerase sigma factor [Steroidobacteraceae bacterium]
MATPLPRAVLGEAAEAAVVALAMGGDRAAFGELVRRRQSWLRNLLRRLCRDPALADDLAQQVFLQAWRSLPALHSVTAFGPWLRRLAVNAWLAHRRTARPGSVPLDPDEPDHAAAFVPASSERLDLDRALAQLSPAERLCIVLAYSEGMSHGEISAATALPLGTVKSHVRRGAERLRGLLHAYNSFEEQTHVGSA